MRGLVGLVGGGGGGGRAIGIVMEATSRSDFQKLAAVMSEPHVTALLFSVQLNPPTQSSSCST